MNACCLNATVGDDCWCNVPKELDSCPHLRFYRSIAGSYLRQFAGAESREERNRVLDSALTIAKMAVQVIAPLAQNQGPDFKAEYLAIADSLFALARSSCADDLSWERHPANFSAADDRQMLVAKIEELGERVSELRSAFNRLRRGGDIR